MLEKNNITLETRENKLEKIKKKSFRKTMVTTALSMGMLLGCTGMLVGCGEAGPKGDTGAQGPQGAQGIQGETGAAGADGATWLTGTTAPATESGKVGDLYLDSSTYDIYTKTNYGWAKIGNIKGEQGEPGTPGESGSSGSAGATGSVWLTGATDPQETDGKVGDIYLNTTTYDLFSKTSQGWDEIGNIKGNPGEPGTPGTNGNKWSIGEGEPTTLGNAGDMYLDTTTYTVYIMGTTEWEVVGSIKGESGTATQWHYGSDEPAEGIGGLNDFYLNTANGDVYNKTDSGWLEIANIKGSKGDTGASTQWHYGATTPADTLGNTGDMYLDTATCNVYAKGETNWILVTNIKGSKGDEAEITINESGYWVINGQATEVKAKGENGTTPTIAINEDGYWVINGTVTDVNARGQGVYGEVLVSSALTTDDFAGKTITIFGDSITAGVGSTDNLKANSYANLACNKLGATVVNKGSSGTTMCEGVVDGANAARISRLNEIKGYTEATDYIIVALGTNDWDLAKNGDGVKLGTLGSTDTTTIYGAFNVCAKALSENYAGTNTKIFFSTPIISSSSLGNGITTWDNNTKNVHGYSLRDMCNAIIETAAMYDIPTLDMNLLSGIYYNSSTDNNTSTSDENDTMSDNLHPNDLGHSYMADALANFLLANYSYVSSENVRQLNLKVENATTTINVALDSNYVLPTPTAEEKTFMRWVDQDGEYYAGGSVITITKNTTLTAIFSLSREPYVTVVNLNSGQANYTKITVENGSTVATAAPDFEVSNSVGLVASYYKDEACTQEFDLETETITEDTTLYVYWETNPEWFTYSEDGTKITGFDTTYFTSSVFSEVEQIILPRYSTVDDGSGGKVKIVQFGDGSTSGNLFNVDTQVKNITKFIIPEGYTKVAGFTLVRNAVNTVSADAQGFEIHLPSSLTSLGSYSFANIPVTKFVIPESNTTYSVDNQGVLYNKSKTIIYRYPAYLTATSYSIPEGVTRIGDGAFYGNKVLTELTLPSTLTESSSNSAFEKVNNLKTLYINFDVSLHPSVLQRAGIWAADNTFKESAIAKEGGSVYVINEASKTALTNILTYGTATPTLDNEDTSLNTQPITDDDFYTSGRQTQLIANIKVKTS